MDIIDEYKEIPYRLFRDECIYSQNGFIKDLTILDRDLNKVIIVDNSPISYSLQIRNGLPISSWFDDQTDIELTNYIPILEMLAKSEAPLEIISKLVDGVQINYRAVANCLKSERENELQIEAKKEALKNKQKSDASVNNKLGNHSFINYKEDRKPTIKKVEETKKQIQKCPSVFKGATTKASARESSKSTHIIQQFNAALKKPKKSIGISLSTTLKAPLCKTPLCNKPPSVYSPPKTVNHHRTLFTNLIKMSLNINDQIMKMTPKYTNGNNRPFTMSPNGKNRSNSQMERQSHNDELRNILNINSPKKPLPQRFDGANISRPKSSVSKYLILK
jgi:hypothetical protein